MAVKKYKPTTPGQRGMTGYTFEEITKSTPERSLTVSLGRHGGRNSYGRVTVRHRGGGNRRMVRRSISSARSTAFRPRLRRSSTIRTALPGWPCCSMPMAKSATSLRRWTFEVGDTLLSGPNVEIRPGTCLPISNIPVGTLIHNIELKQGRGGQIVRSAGGSAQLLGKEGDFAQVRLPSGEVRLIHQVCYATIGTIGNLDHGNIKLGKAGRKRHKGIRPTVRGSAMSPRDHPHGGGEGRQPIGLPGPKSPWGKPTLGYKTRRNQKSNQYIVRRRSKSSR